MHIGTPLCKIRGGRIISGRFRVSSWVREPGKIATSELAGWLCSARNASSRGRSSSSSKYGCPTRPPRNAAGVIPGGFEGKTAQDLINVLPNLTHTPAGPGPDLGWDEVKHGDRPRLRAG